MTTITRNSFDLINTVEAVYTGGKVVLSEDGSSIYCTCNETIRELNATTGEVIANFKDDDDDVTCFALSPDKAMLVTATKNIFLHKFSLAQKTFIDRWKVNHKAHIVTMEFDHSSTLIVTGSSDSTIKVYDIEKKYCTHNFKGALAAVSSMQFHPDADRLVLFAGYHDGELRMWDLKTSKCISILKGHLSAVTSLIFLSKEHLVTCGRDKVLVTWDLAERKMHKTLPVYESIETMTCLPSEREGEHVIITAGESGWLRKWSFPKGQCLVQSEKASFVINQIEYDEARELLIAISSDHNILLYNKDTLKVVNQFIGYYDEIIDIKLYGAEQEYVVVASNSEQVKLIKHDCLSTSKIISGHTDIVLSLDVSYDGKYIAICSKDNTITVWCLDNDLDKFCCIATGKGHAHHVCDVAWPKTSTDYLVSCSKDLTLKCWKLPHMIIKSDTIDLQVAWTEKAHDKDINAVSVSPNDKFLVSASQDKLAKLWKMKSGKHVGVLRGHKRGIWCAEFSPVDQCVATGSVDSTIKLWALSNLSCVKTFEGHSNSVLRLAFINRGMQLISSGSEGLIKVWSIRNDECVATLEGHDDKVWALAVSKSQEMVISGGADATIKIWKDTTDQVVADEQLKEEEKLQKQQELANLMEQKQYHKALEHAIALNHPRTALKIFDQILNESGGENVIGEVIAKLSDTDLENLLEYICDWNTNAKNTFISQSVLSQILMMKSYEDLLEIVKIKEIIESLVPYTERHYDRVNRLITQSMFINYTWESMKLPLIDLNEQDSRSISADIDIE